MPLRPEIEEYYGRGEEPERLTPGAEGRLEYLRTQALLERLLRALERVESAPSLLGASAHLLAVGRRG